MMKTLAEYHNPKKRLLFLLNPKPELKEKPNLNPILWLLVAAAAVAALNYWR